MQMASSPSSCLPARSSLSRRHRRTVLTDGGQSPPSVFNSSTGRKTSPSGSHIRQYAVNSGFTKNHDIENVEPHITRKLLGMRHQYGHCTPLSRRYGPIGPYPVRPHTINKYYVSAFGQITDILKSMETANSGCQGKVLRTGTQTKSEISFSAPRSNVDQVTSEASTVSHSRNVVRTAGHSISRPALYRWYDANRKRRACYRDRIVSVPIPAFPWCTC